MIRALHISDIHLDRPFRSRNEKITKLLSEAIRTAFRRAVSFCIEQELDVLLIAGDLFDGELVEPGTAFFLKRELDRLAVKDIPVVYATGNHDCSRRIRHLAFFNWPENVHIAWHPEPTVFKLCSKGGETFQVVTCGHDVHQEMDNVVSKFPSKAQLNTTEVVIGMAHSWVTNFQGESKEPYLPCEVADLSRLDYDYFALGHIHKQTFYLDGRAAYAGSLQSVTRDETGSRGGILVELDRGAVKTKAIGFAGATLLKQEVDVEDLTTLEEVSGKINRVLAQTVEEMGMPPHEILFSVDLIGRSGLRTMLEQPAALEALKENVILTLGVVDVEFDVSRLLAQVRPEEYLETDTLLGHLLRTLSSEDALEEVVDELLQGIKLSTSHPSDSDARAWVRKILLSSSEELTHRLVKSEVDSRL